MNTQFRSLKGHLLLDAGGMYGSSFHHSIILMCQHSPEGAFGLVLNQASDNCVGDILPFNLPPDVKQQPVRKGGPVDEQSVYILHSDAFMFQGNVLNNLSLMQDLNELNDLAPIEGITGMAIGVDQDFAEICMDLDIPFLAYIPFVGQENNWPVPVKAEYQNILERSEDIIVVNEGGYTPKKMMERNFYQMHGSHHIFHELQLIF